MEGKHGACGFLSVLFPSAIPVYLVKIEEETGEPIRDKNGLCVVCKPGRVSSPFPPFIPTVFFFICFFSFLSHF